MSGVSVRTGSNQFEVDDEVERVVRTAVIDRIRDGAVLRHRGLKRSSQASFSVQVPVRGH